MLKIFRIQILLLLFLLFLLSCIDNKPDGESEKDNSNNETGENQKCKEKPYERFDNIRINKIQFSKFNIDEFTEINGEPDSIIDGYYFYGESKLLFEEDKVVFVEIVDENLRFSDFLSINIDFSSVKSRFPCSFENRSKTEYHFVESEAINIYDKHYNTSIPQVS